ncbi:MAG: hypothetical protein K6G90_03000 [Clostridia bacterium]|nr:hypothetical protein [Clostridia bacterium]
MSEHILESNGFCLRFVLNVFESDIEYPINTNMTVSVKSNEFSAKTDLDIDIKAFADFTYQLKKVYDTLSGEAMIKEPYGYQRYISFQADKTGHVIVKGYICDDMKNNELYFENSFDQTFLKSFSNELCSMYLKYKQEK